MHHLPHDIIILIATHLRRDHHASAHLLRFIQVSKTWYALGLPLLYGNIALANHSLYPFACTFDPSKGRFVRSLSLHVHATLPHHGYYPSSANHEPVSQNSGIAEQTIEFATQETPDFVYTSSQPVDGRRSSQTARFISVFAHYIPLLRSLNNLASFSLIIEASAYWCTLPRSTIAGLIDALPETCINLELDTHANDKQDQNLVHVCQNIRQVLPRLRNVRLRLGTMCSALFEPRPNVAFGIDLPRPVAGQQSVAPIMLPKINSLVLNCGVATYGELLPQCGYEGHRKWEIGAEAWCAITSSLTELVMQQASSLKDAKLLVLSPTWGLASDLSLETQLRTDMVNKVTWALPCIPEAEVRARCFLIRSPDGSEQVIESLDLVDDIAEGHVWRDVMGGARLPYDILEAEKRDLPSFATGCLESPIADLMEYWLRVDPDVPKSRTFCNEKKTGKKLALAEKRTGHHFLALRPVKEITPDGWVRTSSDLELVPT